MRCAAPLPAEGTCGACVRHPPAFDAAACAFTYAFPVDRLVQRFKFAADFAVGRWLGEALAARVAGEARPDLLVATPLAARRLRERGFNQAAELARALGRRLEIPVAVAALAKVRDTEPQARLGSRERRENLRGAFACRAEVAGLHLAVVDDVITTGATAGAAASVLKEAGAARVSAWAVARTP